MRKMFKIISITAAIVFTSSLATSKPLGPVGDDCSTALIAYDGANSFDTTNATPSMPEPDESQCAGTELNWNLSPDIWFLYVPTTSGLHRFTTCDAASYDTSMALYELNCSNQVACNGDDTIVDNNCQNFHSTIEYPLTALTAYYVRIGGWQGGTGTGTLTIDPSNGGGSNIWYVNESNVAPGGGTDWATAFLDLQDALDVAQSGDQIWIAQGTYTPSDLNSSTDPREASYRLIAGVEIYGGFSGIEDDVDLRRPQDFRVTLTGDINNNDDNGGDNSENAYHVLTADNLVGISPILDGVYVTAGNANSYGNNKFGGGLLVENYAAASLAYPDIHQTHFIFNDALYGGAVAIADSFGAVSLTRCVLSNNMVSEFGGAIINQGYCRIDNCLLVANAAETAGGAIYSTGSDVVLVGSTIVQNVSNFVGGLYFTHGDIDATNNIIWGNEDRVGNNDEIYLMGGTWTGDYNCIQNIDQNLAGPNSIPDHPRFLNEFGDDGLPRTGDENFHLLQQSPCIDVGDNSVVVVTEDLIGNDRIINDPYTLPDTAVVDMGAYEHVEESNDVWIWTGWNSFWFYDELNWLPQGVPYAISTTLFNTNGVGFCDFDGNAEINRLLVTEGSYTISLNWNLLTLDSSSQILQVDDYRTGASVFIKEGTIQTAYPLPLNGGDITLQQITLDVGELLLSNNTFLSFDGHILGNVTNEGSTLSASGDSIGTFTIDGNLLNSGDGELTGRLVGSMPFNINGLSAGVSHDYLEVTGAIDMTCSFELLWRNFTPIAGNAIDLMTVGSATGEPTLIYNSGLPSHLAIRWITPTALRGGEEVVVETTGPILFDVGNALALTTETPSDIVVGDFNNDNYPDVAISVSAAGGATGSVVVLTNNGMSGATWLGLSAGTPITVGVDPLDIEIGDFNGDGTADDLVVANNGDDSVSILSNDGSGVFTKTDVSTSPDTGPLYIAVVDFVSNDLLGLDDIVVACSSNNAAVLHNSSSLGSRAISFAHVNSVAIPTPGGISPGDVTTDKDFDIIVLDLANDKLRLMEGNGDGTVATVPLGDPVGNPLPENAGPIGLVLADLDGDAIDDAITVNESVGSLSVLLDTGDAFGNASSFDVGTSPQSIVVHDFDNDGDNDLVVSMIGDVSGNRELTVIRNDTVATVIFSEGDAFGSGSEPVMVGHGDFDRDGLEDLVSLIDLNPIARNNSPAISVFFNVTEEVVDCPADIDGDGNVAVSDILALIGAWGTIDPDLDIDESGLVDVGDILLVVSNWGTCP